MKNSQKYTSLVFIALVGLVLAGCGGNDQEAEGGNVGSSPNGEVHTELETTDPKTEVRTEPEAEIDSSPEAAPRASSGKECLIGNWYINDAKFAELMSSIAGFEVSGTAGSGAMTIQEDGTTTTHYDDWSYTFEQEGMSMTVEKSGTDEAIYDATDDGGLTVREVAMNAVTTLKTDAGSFAYDSSDDPMSMTEARYVCEGDVLTISTEGGGVVFGREH